METWAGAKVPPLPGRGSGPRLLDTATGEPAAAALPSRRGAARLYACGITPYDATHIGHAATFVAWDLLVRAWRDSGHDVLYVQNVTDVDDPLLERAARDRVDWRELADSEIGRYREDMTALRVLPPTHLVGAVEALGTIDTMNQQMAGRGATYELDTDVYFARSADANFGSLSGLSFDEMRALSAERGGDPGRPGKKDPLDCIVWVGARAGEPAWDSSFGRGRPGWHVECAAIATEYLGARFDVQAGGTDLVFPHHEMSACHARVASGDPDAFARVYAHSGMVGLDGQKMSKSLGNLVLVSDLLSAGVDPMAVRLALLAHHYRRDWDWSDAVLVSAQQRLERWRRAVSVAAGPPADPVLAAVRERLADDLDAPGALAAVDAWASSALGSGEPGPAQAGAGPAQAGAGPAQEPDPAAPRLIRDTVDALLGVAL
jgi:L-cysteine:1D-myo-inositol 2-amino-2-deoxy-alpha-D-glucopyranoside ligase